MMKSMVRYEEVASDPTAVWRIVSATNYKAVWENEKTRRSVELRRITLKSTQGKHWMGAPEGNFNPPPTGYSAVPTGWGQDPLPRSSLASPTWNHQKTSQEPALVRQWPQNPKEYLSQPLQKHVIIGYGIDGNVPTVRHNAIPGVSNEMKSQAKQEILSSDKEASENVLEVKNETNDSTDATVSKSGKPKIKGVSMTELFTPKQIQEHINSLRLCVGQSKAKAEKNQAIGHSENENSCQLCKVEKLTFEPSPTYCFPGGARKKQNAPYYTAGDWVRLKEEDKKRSQVVRVWDPGSGSKSMNWGDPVMLNPEFVMCDTTLHLSVSSHNCGRIETCGNMLSFNAVTEEAFEVSLADVSQTQMQGETDVVLEFHVNDTIGANEKGSLMDLSFQVQTSNTQIVGDEHRPPAQNLWQTILSMADAGNAQSKLEEGSKTHAEDISNQKKEQEQEEKGHTWIDDQKSNGDNVIQQEVLEQKDTKLDEKNGKRDKTKDDKEKKSRDHKMDSKQKSLNDTKEKKKSDEPPKYPGFILQAKRSKESKVRSTSLSLDGLLDYTANDTEESVFELSLFAESFSEMLQYRMGCVILSFLENLHRRYVMKRNQRKRQREEDLKKEDKKSSEMAVVTFDGIATLTPRELAKQMHTEFAFYGATFGLSSCCVYGGSDYRHQEVSIRRGVDIIVGTPGRVKDFIVKGTLNLKSLKFRVLDEADEMLNMGFVDDVELILGKVADVTKVQTLLFSATIPTWVKKLSLKFLKDNKKTVDLVGDEKLKAIASVKYLAFPCSRVARAQIIPDIARSYNHRGRTIIFTETKESATEISGLIAGSHALHGDVVQAQREVILVGFRSGKFLVLVATNMAARGLDINDVAQSAGTEAAEAIANLSSQYFDLLVKLKNDQEHLFRNMPRNEYHNLFNFIIGKYLKILNLEMGTKDMEFVQLLVSLQNSRFISRWNWSGSGQSTWQPPDWVIEPRPGVYYLDVLKDGEVIDRINLGMKRHIFGRQVPACYFVLDHQSVSRQYAVISPHKNGSIYVIDLGSVHGTFVAKERLTKDDPVELEIGQSLRLAASIRTYILRKNFSKLPMEASWTIRLWVPDVNT